jgi:hypothetical protein
MGAGVESGRTRRIDTIDVEIKVYLQFNGQCRAAGVVPRRTHPILRTPQMSDAFPKWPLRAMSALSLAALGIHEEQEGRGM